MPDLKGTSMLSSGLSDVIQVRLPGIDGNYHSVSSLAGQTATVVVFVSNGCPTVRAYEERLKDLQRTKEAHGVRVIAINANNPYLSPPDTMLEMVKHASDQKLNFTYLKDEDGTVAKGFGAVCTPHAFVLNKELKVVYSGRIDDSRLGDRISSPDLDNAISDVLAGRAVVVKQTDPFGCSIVW